MPVATVTQLNKYLASVFRSDRNLQGIMIKGEISNFVCHYKSGHFYFTIKDSESLLKAVMFSQEASRLKFLPEDGMSIIASGNIVVYERDGVYQLNVRDIIPDGKGRETVVLEQLKQKLAKEGIFDTAHKRPLPYSVYPHIDPRGRRTRRKQICSDSCDLRRHRRNGSSRLADV